MSHVDIGRYSKRIVQAFWDPEPVNQGEAPIWCLGRCYESAPELSQPPDVTRPVSAATSTKPRSIASSFEHVAPQDNQDQPLPPPPIVVERPWPAAFLDDFESRLWLTYRFAFAPIPKSQDPKAASAMSLSVRLKSHFADRDGFSSDTGWGCMIRSGQSLLANAICINQLGRDWTRNCGTDRREKQILQWFADDPHAPFSIHKFVEHGAAACGTFPGQWFGPSATSKCIEALVRTYEVAGLRVYVTGDGPDVYEETVMEIAKGDGHVFRPTLLLIGTRLGISRVTPVYRDALLRALRMRQSVGIAGGRPSSSHYFVGTQASRFFYLDPHLQRAALPYREDPADYTEEEVDSCHTRRLRCLDIEEMDPSMLIAFLLRDESDWKDWKRAVSDAPGKAIFNVAEKPPPEVSLGTERSSAVDEVEAFDDDEDDGNSKGIA